MNRGIPIACATLALLLGIVANPEGARAGCTVQAQELAFGEIDVLPGHEHLGAGDIIVTCEIPTAYTLELGTGQSGMYSARKMTGGNSGELYYDLFTNFSRTNTWGDGSAGTHVQSGEADGHGQQHTIYGRVDGGQRMAPPGAYSDTIVLTVVY